MLSRALPWLAMLHLALLPLQALSLSEPLRPGGGSGDGRALPWRAIEASASFVEGHAGPIIIAFIDPECAACSQLWRRLRAPLAAGRLRVRWIPVAVLSAASAQRGAALLRSADPVTALAAQESRQSPRAPPAAGAEHGLEDVAANTALLSALTSGQLATPVLLARTAAGRQRLLIGMPADIDEFVAQAR